MPQEDYNIENQLFPPFRTDLNNNLGAIVTNNSGSTEPVVTFPYMLWADTTAGLMKQRNAANDGWIEVWSLVTGGNLDAVRKDPGVGDTLNPLIPQPVDRRALIFSDKGGGDFEMVMSEFDPDTPAQDAQDSADAAMASEQAAATSEGNAATSEGNAATSETNAGNSETNAASSEGNAVTSETNAANSETAAGISETNAANSATAASDQLEGTSVTSLAIATGAKVFTTEADKFFEAGVSLKITSDANPANLMFGAVTSYSGTTLTMNIVAIGGSGTFADWTIRLSGVEGPAGGGGKVLQVLQGSKTDALESSPGAEVFVDIGLSVLITPGNILNKVLITGVVSVSNNISPPSFSTDPTNLIRLKRNGVVIGDADPFGSRTTCMSSSAVDTVNESGGTTIPINFLDSPGTLSSLTYTVEVAPFGVGSFSLNRGPNNDDFSSRGLSTSNLTAMEIGA